MFQPDLGGTLPETLQHSECSSTTHSDNTHTLYISKERERGPPLAALMFSKRVHQLALAFLE